MKKIERRALMCLLLTAALALGLLVFVFRYIRDGSDWVAFAANRTLYNSSGELKVGRVLDRDGDVLSWVDEGGRRQYYQNAVVRTATLHAVGDAQGKIGTGALSAFADKLAGYNLLTGAYSAGGQGNDLYLTLDARYNYAAYQALNGRKGAVGVYNYETGEILCMVSAPSYDPADPPDVEADPEWYDGVYLNRFLSGRFAPGSTFKVVTLAAALEQLPDLFSRTWTCTGETVVGGETITCPSAHGTMNIEEAFTNSCNGVFAQLAVELGAETLARYGVQAGLTGRYSVNGISTAAGSLGLSGAEPGELGWAGVGQYTDLVNPCGLMVYMGAIAQGGRAAVPRLILKVQGGLPWLDRVKKTDILVQADTAAELRRMMARNVTELYGASRFPNMEVCAKSGTAEVGGDQAPNAWFAGFLTGEDTPYAFVVLVENGGSGAQVAGDVAAAVLDLIVNGY